MPGTECFDFTHNAQYEHIKYLTYAHYRRELTVLYGTPPNIMHILINDKDLVALADAPIVTPDFFGTKIAIALAYQKPSVFFRRCVENGQLQEFFPELYDCIGCSQDPNYHTDDVFDHTMLAIDSAEKVGVSDLDTKLAILFHDIGKILTRKVTIVE
jgi:hypothetical protein